MSYLAKARARLQASQLVRGGAGLSPVEYVIILVLLAAIAIGTWQTFGRSVSSGRSGASQSSYASVGVAPRMLRSIA